MTATFTPRRWLTLVFRFRYALHTIVYATAFVVSWTGGRGAGSRHLWLRLPQWVAPALGVEMTAAIIAVTVLAIVFSAAGAFLRTWGTAYLQPGVVVDSALEGRWLAVDGPYRYVRNPLYLGTVLYTLALCVLMTVAGAVIALAGALCLQIALVAVEERFLAESLGEPYRAYTRLVPRFFPRLRPIAGSGDAAARWPSAFLGEINMWGTAVSFAVLGWRYNALLVLQGVVVSFGLWIVVRGLQRTK